MSTVHLATYHHAPAPAMMSNRSTPEAESRMVHFIKSGGLIRTTPVMLHWPWLTHIALEKGGLGNAVWILKDEVKGLNPQYFDTVLVCGTTVSYPFRTEIYRTMQTGWIILNVPHTLVIMIPFFGITWVVPIPNNLEIPAISCLMSITGP